LVDIDVPLARHSVIVGENRSGKSHVLTPLDDPVRKSDARLANRQPTRTAQLAQQ
jgi:predicted ATPase